MRLQIRIWLWILGLVTDCVAAALQGNAPAEAEHYMGLAKETIEQLKSFAMDLRQQGQPIDNVVMT